MFFFGLRAFSLLWKYSSFYHAAPTLIKPSLSDGINDAVTKSETWCFFILIQWETFGWLSL